MSFRNSGRVLLARLLEHEAQQVHRGQFFHMGVKAESKQFTRLLATEVKAKSAKVQIAEKKSQERRENAIMLSLLGVGLTGAGYYYYQSQIVPRAKSPMSVEDSGRPQPLGVGAAKPFGDASISLVELAAAKSPREDLTENLARLEAELMELRKVKAKDPLVDLKKKEIKSEIQMIQRGLSQLDKMK